MESQEQGNSTNDIINVGKLPVSKVLFDEYDVEIAWQDHSHTGTLSVVQRGEYGFVEWNPYENYDVNAHMSFDEWGVIAHDTTKAETTGVSPIQLAIASIDEIRHESGGNAKQLITITVTERQTFPTIVFLNTDSVNRFIQSLKRYLCFLRKNNVYAVDHSKAALRNVMRELELGEGLNRRHNHYRKVYDFQDVYDVTLSGLSKVTNFLKVGLTHKPQTSTRPTAQAVQEAERQQNQAEISASVPNPDHILHKCESDFELYDVRKPLEQAVPVSRDVPVTRIEWESHLDMEGRVHRIKELQDRIFGGGIEPELRTEIWPFLLNVYGWDTTVLERSQIMESKRKEYEIMKNQWKSILPCQAKRSLMYRDRSSLVEKDCFRTDRLLDFYKGENNQNIQTMYGILMTYCQYNHDLGYVQGMSDLLSPLFILFKEEVLSFWVFAGYMDIVERHFFMDQLTIQEKLSEITSLVYYCDSELYNHLEKEESANFFFCFRWLLINFKREFKEEEVLCLWEALWTCPYNTDYSLFIATAILLQERDCILRNKMNSSELIKYINTLSGKLDLVKVLGQAESLYHTIRSQHDIPFNIKTNILHLPHDSPYSSLESGKNLPIPRSNIPPVLDPGIPSVLIEQKEDEDSESSVEAIPETDDVVPCDPASILRANVDEDQSSHHIT